ncbi:histidine phosphatase family protein [Ligilactobacillus ceti]|uniref:Phosphoglycerate mutase n=1 Tax=Ligilactobacillus ceti DSM 22408 TaxID=1122146 RepID=A0A0R2KJ30_9LACO|nr:histidine phosphatase family protein [Ligilactobacillus ceti]KRN89336.1 hypothetical protein IV53_GL000053 [Ligilactobacillus ceti DSM 22408]
MKKTMYMMCCGETLFDELHRMQGWCDSPLTNKGIDQAKQAYEVLKERNFDATFCSYTRRAIETAEIISRSNYKKLLALNEMYFGTLEGTHFEKIGYPEMPYDEIMNYFAECGGESGREASRRIMRVCRDIMDKKGNDEVLVISHSLVASLLARESWMEDIEIDPEAKIFKGVIFKYSYRVSTKEFKLEEIINPAE